MGLEISTAQCRGCRSGADRCRFVEMRLVKVVGLSIGGTAALPAFAVFGGEEERDLGEPQEAGPAASPREESPAEQAEVILTPDQRVRVFISSTLEELAAERVAARRAIARLHLVPVWYESGARPHPPRSMYRAYLAQSQVFVGIYWQRYGWVAPGMRSPGWRMSTGWRRRASRCCCI